MILAAHYYIANPPYFGDLARNAIEDDSFVPTKRAYEKMVENKYAAKVIESTRSQPKFALGSLVALRSGARVLCGDRSTYPGHGLAGKVAFVLKVGDRPVIGSARGCKIYTVLFVGEAKPTHIEERWLKKGKR